MARRDRLFVCQSCGAVHPRWAGRCDSCGAWNSIVEETPASAVPGAAGAVADAKRRKRLEVVELDLATAPPPRLRTGIEELDRTLGGGIVPGAAMLLGGDPGIGKSTLTLQAAASLAARGQKVVYVSGEESLDQIRLRARRLGVASAPVSLASASALFLAERDSAAPGAAVFAGIEGSRPVLVEVQALTAPTAFGTPRRAVVGWDPNRLAMLLAVLETRCGLVTATRDVYLNVAGGLRVQEPAADLAVAAAIVSSELKLPAPPTAVFLGEVGLAGEVRAVGQLEARLKEAAKLGFREAITPRGGREKASGLEVRELTRLVDLFQVFAVAPPRRRAEA